MCHFKALFNILRGHGPREETDSAGPLPVLFYQIPGNRLLQIDCVFYKLPVWSNGSATEQLKSLDPNSLTQHDRFHPVVTIDYY